MSGKAIINLLMDKPVAYRPDLARILGGVKCAVFVCQMLYWTGKGARADGFIWKTQSELEQETGLTRYEQEGARKKLLELGVIEEKRAGIPARMHYRVNLDVLERLISDYYHKQDCGKPTNCIAENQQTITENTAENTSSIDSGESIPASGNDAESSPSAVSPGDSVKFDTEEALKLHRKLIEEAKAKGRRGPKQFPSLAMKRKFIKAASVLDGDFDVALTRAMEQGRTSVTSAVNYLAAWAKNKRKDTQPKVIRVKQ